jgi:CheY-like chemotaxis protein
MDSDTLQHIFEPYFTTKRDQGGNGLGMSVVYGIVKRHEGYINVVSTPGSGTRVSIYFPSTAEGERMSVDSAPTDIKGTETVMIIDDEESIVRMLTDVLSHNGYTVVSETSANEGIKLFEKKKDDVDLVLLDIIMPELNGVDVLGELKKINPDIKVLLASGYNKMDQNEDLIEKGASGFISKPFRIFELLKRIRGLLE